MLILGCRGNYHAHREGSKGQRVKKIISVDIDARKTKFGRMKSQKIISKSVLESLSLF
jgi:hypothetical protein